MFLYPFHVLIATILSQRTRDDNTRKLLGGAMIVGVVGECLFGAVSKPLTAIGSWFPWNKKPTGKDLASAEKVATLFDVMNQRICDLEDKIKTESPE